MNSSSLKSNALSISRYNTFPFLHFVSVSRPIMTWTSVDPQMSYHIEAKAFRYDFMNSSHLVAFAKSRAS